MGGFLLYLSVLWIHDCNFLSRIFAATIRGAEAARRLSWAMRYDLPPP